jgi:hypothetical protein
MIGQKLGLQEWPTQIGLWAATWKICQKYWLFGPQYDKKLGKYTQNNEKSLILDLSLGRRIFYLDRGLASPDLLSEESTTKVSASNSKEIYSKLEKGKSEKIWNQFGKTKNALWNCMG